jgi:hypothetical protein
MISRHYLAIPRHYLRLFAILLKLYPKAYRERYVEGIEQTFRDLLRERSATGGALLPTFLWIVADTILNIFITYWRDSIVFKRIVRLALIVAVLMLVPYIAMQFTKEVDWTLGDFIAMALLVFGAGLLFELIGTRMKTTRHRLATGLACFTGLALVWLNLAVGLIGSENNPANELYAGVLLIALAGAAIARFSAEGLVKTMIATAIAQFLVPIVAILIWHPSVTAGEGPGILGVFVLNGLFVALWLVAAWLYSSRHEQLHARRISPPIGAAR